MLGKIDYESNKDIIGPVNSFIEESLKKLMGDEFTEDWIEMAKHFSSIESKLSEKELTKELNEMTGVS